MATLNKKSGKAGSGKEKIPKKAKTKKAGAPTKKPSAKTVAKKPAKKAPLQKASTAKKSKVQAGAGSTLLKAVIKALEAMKAEDIMVVDMQGQSALTDYFVIASGRSNRQVSALADSVRKTMQSHGVRDIRIEGLSQGDWVVTDGGDVIVHIFRPEVRSFYRLEEVWGLEPPLHETFRAL